MALDHITSSEELSLKVLRQKISPRYKSVALMRIILQSVNGYTSFIDTTHEEKIAKLEQTIEDLQSDQKRMILAIVAKDTCNLLLAGKEKIDEK